MVKVEDKWLLDDTDRRILAYLMNDSRRSYTDIAEKVHLSRVAVAHRVQRLIDTGIIFKFTVTVNRKKLAKFE